MMDNGYYIYAIVETSEERSFGPHGIGGRDDEVVTVCYQDISAIVSQSPLSQYPVSRANTMAHQTVMEKVMQDYPLLPVRFGTVGEALEQIKGKVLTARYDEIKKNFQYLKDKIELGLKVLWIDKGMVFQEIVDENKDIRVLRNRMQSKNGGSQQDQIRLGQWVEKALAAKRDRHEKEIIKAFKGLWVEHKKNKIFGDQMITNSAFLIPKEKEKTFDGVVNNLAETLNGKMKLKYIGPVPPCNFVEIIVKW